MFTFQKSCFCIVTLFVCCLADFCCYYLFSAIFFTLLPDFFFVIFWFGLWPKQIFSLCGLLVHQLNEQRTAHKAESATNRSVIFDLSNRQQQEYKTKQKKQQKNKQQKKKLQKNNQKCYKNFGQIQTPAFLFGFWLVRLSRLAFVANNMIGASRRWHYLLLSFIPRSLLLHLFQPSLRVWPTL